MNPGLLCLTSDLHFLFGNVEDAGVQAWLWLDGGAAVVGVRADSGAAVGLHGGLGGGGVGAAEVAAAAEALAVVLGEDEQHERVDAAVRVAQADADVVGVDEDAGGMRDAQVDHLDDVIRGPAHQKQANDHQHHLGGALGPHRLLALDPPDGPEHVVKSQRVEGAYNDERHDEAQGGLVQRVPIHVLWAVQVHHTHFHVLLGDHLGVDHDGDREQETANPHQQVDDDGPPDGPVL